MASNSALKKAVPSAVAPSTKNSVPVLTEAQLMPYEPMKGSQRIPVVPVTETEGEVAPQRKYGGNATNATQIGAGNMGAPSVPTDGYLWVAGPIDIHYVSEAEVANPYGKVNNPPTRGMWTWVKNYINGIATSQDVGLTGFKQRHAQQRTSHMRITGPPHGAGYAPEIYVPRQLPQRPNTYKYNPAIGTGPWGNGTAVLNSQQFGAGQTAGGIGGNNYTPSPGPPETTSTAGNATDGSGMPTWG